MEHQSTEKNKTLFSAWVADPAGIGFDAGEIESMAVTYPYCQILQSLIAKSAQGLGDNVFKPVLAKASLYSPKRTVLFNLVNHPGKFKPTASAVNEAGEDIYYEVIEEDNAPDDLTADESGSATPPEFENRVENQPGLEQAGSQKETEISITRDEEEKPGLENIAATDFIAVDEKVDIIQADQRKESLENLNDQQAEQAEVNSLKDETMVAEFNEISRYDDDSMPYSFLWWLHKTRKEHADTYQPYIDFRLDTTKKINKRAGRELNQQIIENIFHLQSPLEEIQKNFIPQTVPFELKRKEEDIIEKFIREEPQIHPPTADKLDLENKARRSAEDPNDLVSETLASIYTEQMLFHKAIDTYQKLSLKFPEKRAYFADQISELQKKIN